MSGKTFLSKLMQKEFDYVTVDMKAISNAIKAKLGTEDEPFEGTIPISDVERETLKFIYAQRAARGPKT